MLRLLLISLLVVRGVFAGGGYTLPSASSGSGTPEGTAVLSTGEPAGGILQAVGDDSSDWTLTPSVTTVDATGAITGGSLTDGTATITGGAITGLVSVTLGDNVAITSTDTDTNSIPFRLNNDADSGLGHIGGPTGLYRDGVGVFWNGILWYTLTNGTADLGGTSNSWDDTYTDDLYLQLTTPASEGRIHWEGAAGDSSMGIHPVKADGTAPVTAADAVALSVKMAASPGSGESVEALRVTSGQVLIQGGVMNAPGLAFTSDEDVGFYLTSNTMNLAVNGLQRFAVNATSTFNRGSVVAGFGGTGANASMSFPGPASSTANTSVRACKSDGTLAAPYDSMQVMLSNMGAPSSIEAMRITTTVGVVLPLGLVANAASIGTSLTITEMVEPATPASGEIACFADSADSLLSCKDDTGTVTKMGAGGPGPGGDAGHIVRIADTQIDSSADHPLGGSGAATGPDTNQPGYQRRFMDDTIATGFVWGEYLASGNTEVVLTTNGHASTAPTDPSTGVRLVLYCRDDDGSDTWTAVDLSTIDVAQDELPVKTVHTAVALTSLSCTAGGPVQFGIARDPDDAVDNLSGNWEFGDFFFLGQ